MTRRTFLAASAAPLAAAPDSHGFVKSITSTIFPKGMAHADKFRAVKNAGFDGIEMRLGDEIPMDTPEADLRRMGEQAREAGVTIASLWVSGPISANPLNSPDPAVRAKGVETIKKAVDMAKAVGCGALLIVPGRLGTGARFEVGYEDSWKRITESLKQAIPYAARQKILLTPENVGNKFLVSPLEMRAFIDQFHSPWLQSHFDCGNVMPFGYPQDWILTLGSRIKRLHIKDYKLPQRGSQGRMVDLLEGDVNWKDVMADLVKVGYKGTISPEYGYDPNDPDRIRKISSALDKILAMA